MNQSKICPICGGSRIASGRISGALEPASFQPDETKSLAIGFLSATPSSVRLNRACACIECGHVWAEVSPVELRAVIEKWGSKALKARLLEKAGE